MSNRYIYQIILLMRPAQWLKNTFIFLPLFFHGQMGNIEEWKECLISFCSFCLVASSIYCFNDIHDLDADKNHPQKRNRPIASGRVGKTTAYGLMIACSTVSVSILVLFANDKFPYCLGIIAFYFVMNMLYTIKLKTVPIIDVSIIAIGFVLRVIIGGVSTSIPLSRWIILLTFLLSLFLAFAKRRDDVSIFQSTGVKARKNIGEYTIPFIDLALSITASVTIVCYIMYTVSEEVMQQLGSRHIHISVIFVIIGLLRYFVLYSRVCWHGFVHF